MFEKRKEIYKVEGTRRIKPGFCGSSKTVTRNGIGAKVATTFL